MASEDEIATLKAMTREGDLQAALTLQKWVERLEDEFLDSFLEAAGEIQIAKLEARRDKLERQISLWSELTGCRRGYGVQLDNFGEKKIQVIKEIRALTGAGLKESKSLTDNTPSVVLYGLTRKDATRIREMFLSRASSAGICVSVVPGPPYPYMKDESVHLSSVNMKERRDYWRDGGRPREDE